MAVIYQARLTPSKLELLQAWIPNQPWSDPADVVRLELLGSYRFDDPDGEVGVEVSLLRTSGGRVLQVPVTYRGEALPAAEASLVGTTAHSVLGQRWVYDGCADPVFVTALTTVILTGGHQAEMDVVTDTGYERRELTTRVTGSGDATTSVPDLGLTPTTSVAHTTTTTDSVIHAGPVELTIRRVLTPAAATPAGQTLVGTWPGQGTPTVLATAALR